MPYSPTTWVSGTTPVDAPEMNNLETQWSESIVSLNEEEAAPFVEYGGVATRDGTILSKLNVTLCIYWPSQYPAVSASYILRERGVAAASYTTTVPSTTYFLDFNPDGSVSWGTSHSGTAGALNICSVTTDSSSNINVITDLRGTNVNVWPGAIGQYFFAGQPVARLASAGGGSAGFHIWVGTTDPGGNANEGDIWVKG